MFLTQIRLFFLTPHYTLCCRSTVTLFGGLSNPRGNPHGNPHCNPRCNVIEVNCNRRSYIKFGDLWEVHIAMGLREDFLKEYDNVVQPLLKVL